MFCSKCGKQAEGEFCWNCGAKLFNPEMLAAAIIGGATAKRVEKQYIDTVAVHITTSNVRYPLVKISYTSGVYYDEAETVCGALQQAKLMPPTEQAFELTQKWGTGTAPIKADTVPVSKPKPVEVSSEPWRCTKCDYKNPPASSVCLNCSAPKHKLPEGETHLSEAAQEASAREVWYCPECDYKNTGGKSCRNCGESRPIPQSKNTKNLFGNLLKK